MLGAGLLPAPLLNLTVLCPLIEAFELNYYDQVSGTASMTYNHKLWHSTVSLSLGLNNKAVASWEPIDEDCIVSHVKPGLKRIEAKAIRPLSFSMSSFII
jgi:hypothetical protein